MNKRRRLRAAFNELGLRSQILGIDDDKDDVRKENEKAEGMIV